MGLDAEHERTSFVFPATSRLAEVATTASDRDTAIVVAKVLAIQLEKFEKQNANASCRLNLASLHFGMKLQEADDHDDDTVTSKTTREDFTHASLHEKMLDDKNERSNVRPFAQPAVDVAGCSKTIGMIERDIDFEAGIGSDELDDGHLCFGNDLHVSCQVVTSQTSSHRAKGRLRPQIGHRSADDNQIKITLGEVQFGSPDCRRGAPLHRETEI